MLFVSIISLVVIIAAVAAVVRLPSSFYANVAVCTAPLPVLQHHQLLLSS